MQIHSTWRPYTGDPNVRRSELPASAFAFPRERAEPLTDPAHVRSALARFNQVTGVNDAERDTAFANIRAAGKYFGVAISLRSWHDIGTPGSEDAIDRGRSLA